MSLRDLLDKVDDYTIYSYYLGPFKPGKLMNSPLRNDDKMPSFAIFQTRDGALLFKDHGTGVSGNALKFMKLYKDIQTREELEKELLRIVRRANPTSSVATVTRSYTPREDTDIGIVRQPFTEVDKRYWKQFHISIDTLKRFNVFSIKYFLCNRVVRGTYKEDSPMYAYKVYDKFKIYRPLASKYTKWRHIVIMFDRDPTGMMKAREYSKRYKMDCIFVNKKFKAKDISDAVRDNSFFAVKEWLTKTVERYVK